MSPVLLGASVFCEWGKRKENNYFYAASIRKFDTHTVRRGRAVTHLIFGRVLNLPILFLLFVFFARTLHTRDATRREMCFVVLLLCKSSITVLCIKTKTNRPSKTAILRSKVFVSICFQFFSKTKTNQGASRVCKHDPHTVCWGAARCALTMAS